ncbi:hypothetical protein PSEUBRA_001278 [Kalmanozyma brasiliensis GHG001]|uniref:uncharacterized protein n=1 Tax=Kalmanozyma brasiliensis (strain GHG001) TaxID=1365824 RepID=UPI0028682AA9|nr:uncharacterized protein PSEUBRA_001278 [Kalmanozyma brasiliensis GHG001]KAF6766914.1 hypothetical protein PSEUBRA_001278 [Kalmanozyma brasiliensis GHG001]
MSPQPDQADRKRKLPPSNEEAPRANPVDPNSRPSPIIVGSSSPPADSSVPTFACTKPDHASLAFTIEDMYRASSADWDEVKEPDFTDMKPYEQDAEEANRQAIEHHHRKIKDLFIKVKETHPELDLTDVSDSDGEEEGLDEDSEAEYSEEEEYE